MPAVELIGREVELARLTGMLGDDDTRLVTVTGPAGVGKTRLAVAAADALAPGLSGGVLRVDLSPLEDARLVAEAIAVAAGAGSSGAASALEAATAALCSERSLLLLDNFEHVEAAAGDLGALLDACPGATALVTSRHVLGLSAERMLPLAPLDTHGAIALFVARAQARDPGFELTPEHEGAIAEICARLDGLPLAIELAAARIAVLSPSAMLARWDAALGLDTPGARDLPSRQRTLRAAFDWSYELLEEDERALLRRLAAFPDGFGVEAVEAAQRGDGGALAALALDPIATLAALADRSLLHRATAPAAEPRFSMLTTVRLYLRERLAQAGEAEAAELWMARACAASVRREGRQFTASWSREEFDAVDRELNNVRAALEVLLERAPALAVELCGDLFRVWQARHVREGRDWVARALAAGGAEVAPTIRARAHFVAVWLAHFQGDYEAEQRSAQRCLAAAREAGEPLILVRALYASAVAVMDADPAASEALYRESLALSESVGDDLGVATASNDLGELARARGDFDEAHALYSRALELWRTLGDATGVCRAAHNLGQLALATGDVERAGALLRESLHAGAQMGDLNLRAGGLAAVTSTSAQVAPTMAAATLYGAAEAAMASMEVVLDPIDAIPFEHAHELLCAALGEQRVDEARARGRELDDEQVQRLVERALRGRDAAEGADDVLSPREREVVRYVAAGLTNAEIAGRLVLSEHTVHRHVANILVKLGARSRAAAAVTAAERGLL